MSTPNGSRFAESLLAENHVRSLWAPLDHPCDDPVIMGQAGQERERDDLGLHVILLMLDQGEGFRGQPETAAAAARFEFSEEAESS